MDPQMLARLEAVADIAAEAGLQTMPTLFSGHMSGVNWLPAWTLDPATPHGRFRTIANGAESPYGIGDFYTGPLLDAQVLFARSVGERLRAHPAVLAWDLGNEFSNLREPASEFDAAEWSRRLTKALEETSGMLCAPHAFATMHGYTVYSWFSRDRLDPEVVPFLAYLAAGFSYKPVLFSEFGNPTCPPRKRSPFERVALPDEPPNPTISPDDPVFAPYACLTEDELAAYCTSVLERLHADGRLGAYWWCWADYADELRGEPPFDRAPHELSFGIVRSDGSEKPVAAALSAFARERRTVVEPRDIPVIADVYYYRTLPTSTKTLYDAFLGSVEERRRAAR
jgi:endo-1,4-beta-mannosidase